MNAGILEAIITPALILAYNAGTLTQILHDLRHSIMTDNYPRGVTE